ncbi:MAG TPA: M55 family metallopeptidase [Vicinamibacterales bacterium]
MRVRHLVTVFLAVLVCTVTAAGPRPLKVLVLCDMEGVSEATSLAHTNYNTPEYQEARISLTADVNAAIAGLKAAGVGEIVVVDGHGSGNTVEPDVFENKLVAPARMISRNAPFDIYMDSYDHSVDAVVAIAMHAGAGNRSGFLSHTYSGVAVDYRVNGAPFNETMILAMGAARLKIPIVAVSGDDQLERELRRNLPWVQYAMVKHAVDRTRAEPLARDEIDRRITAAARAGIEKLDAARLPDVGGPYRFALTFRDEAETTNAALFPGADTALNARTVQVRANDFEEGYRKSLRLLGLAGAAARETALQAVMATAPDAAAWRARIGEWNGERFLDRVSPPVASAPTGKPRYWGAR